MPKAICILAILLFHGLLMYSQNLSGTWEGYSDNGTEYWRMSIVHIGDSCFCSSYDASGNSYCKQNFCASFNKEENKFKGQGTGFISRTVDHVLITAALQYSKEEGGEYLTGNVKAKSILAQVFSFGMSSESYLKKVSNKVDSTEYIRSAVRRISTANIVSTIKPDSTKKDSLITTTGNKIPDSSVIKKAKTDSVIAEKNKRSSTIAQTITTQADTVSIFVSDDGDIDGDIVTIFDNDRIIAQHLLLTKEPYKITLTLPQNGSKHTIELMAENEGSIPPNTAYMLVLAGTERVEVKASSGKNSNAAVVVLKSNRKL